MQQFPGIDFRWSLTVWELYHVWVDHDRDAARVLRNYPSLRADHVSHAVVYAQAHLHELPESAFGTRPPFTREVRV